MTRSRGLELPKWPELQREAVEKLGRDLIRLDLVEGGRIYLEQARAAHIVACRPYEEPWHPVDADPFGTPHGMPPHRWRVSTDVLQALYAAPPPPYPLPNPKSGDNGDRRLFGWRVDWDKTLPPGTLLLEPLR